MAKLLPPRLVGLMLSLSLPVSQLISIAVAATAVEMLISGGRAVAEPTEESSGESFALPTDPRAIELEPQQSLTLEEALELGQNKSPLLQTALSQLRQSQAFWREVRAQRRPTLKLEGEVAYARDAEETIDELQDDEIEDPGLLTGATLELDYTLWASGKRSAQIAAAQERIRLEELNLSRIQTQIRAEIAATYYDAQEAQINLRMADLSIQLAERRLRDAELLFAGDRGSQFDVAQARLELANVRQARIEAESEREIAQRTLTQSLNLGDRANVAPIETIQPSERWELSLADSILLAYQNRVELQQQQIQGAIAQHQQRAELASRAPNLDVFANYQLLDDVIDDVAARDGFAVGLRLEWLLLDGGAAKAAGDRQIEGATIAESNFVALRNQIRLEVETAYRQLEANRHRIENAQLAIAAAQERVQAANLRFEAGTAAQTEIFIAENELARAKERLARAILAHNRTLQILEQAVSCSSSVS